MISEAFASSDTNNFGHLSTRIHSNFHTQSIDDPLTLSDSAPSVSARSASSHAERKLSPENF
ncbi:hypothetical protein C4D60_Mb11t01890 [Musa balbisiana]|uniref:Uncharacterized protein n=1 Tax=Musa balbisiana TaxID=52838 RepID=A0A4S8J133_MUSBA|nr:hypothetical protein C4D60_Mb11t01890 [Musa balbisiana]